jgi:opacity protein-like surface antigen
MRKLGVVAVAVASLMIMAFAAYAAEAPVGADMKGKISISAFGGLAMPSGALGEKFDPETEGSIGADMKMGPNFGLTVDYFVTKEVAIGVDGSYTMMNMEDQTFDVDGTPTTFEKGLKAKTMQGGVHGTYFIPTGGKVLPYLFVGVGMYNRKLELSQEFQDGLGTTESSFSDTKVGANGGVGVQYKVNEMFGVGLNGAYHMSIGKLEHDFGGDVGNQEILKDWQYMAFNAAVTYYIPMAKK